MFVVVTLARIASSCASVITVAFDMLNFKTSAAGPRVLQVHQQNSAAPRSAISHFNGSTHAQKMRDDTTTALTRRFVQCLVSEVQEAGNLALSFRIQMSNCVTKC